MDNEKKQQLRQGILAEIEELYAYQGDFIIDAILDGISRAFIFEFMDGNGNLDDAEEEVTIKRKRLFAFSFEIYNRVKAVKHLKSAFDKCEQCRY